MMMYLMRDKVTKVVALTIYAIGCDMMKRSNDSSVPLPIRQEYLKVMSILVPRILGDWPLEALPFLSRYDGPQFAQPVCGAFRR